MAKCRCEGELLKIEKMLSEIKEKKGGGGGTDDMDQIIILDQI